MGKHDADEGMGFFLGGAELIKNIVLGIKNNIKIIGIVALIPIIGIGAYQGSKYLSNKKNSNDSQTVPVVASDVEKDTKQFIGGYEVIGKVKINHLGIDVDVLNPVLEENDYTDDALNYGTVLYYGKKLNEIGNCTIIGHNTASTFLNLKNIEVDDELVIANSNGVEVTYTVTSIESVEPDDVSVVLQSEENAKEITLITCDDDGTTRLVVKAISK